MIYIHVKGGRLHNTIVVYSVKAKHGFTPSIYGEYAQKEKCMKRIIVSILVLVMMLSLFAGCGGGTSTDTTKDAAAQTDTSKDADATAEADAKKEPAKEEDSARDSSGIDQSKAGVDVEVKTTENTTAVGEYKQSPFLDGKNLAPVEERLPKNPKVVNEIPESQMQYQVGKYGGTLRTIRMDPVWDAVMWTALEEPLINSPGRLAEQLTPNVLESFEVSDDQTTFTFKLREGHKWSNGDPVTTEDVRFAYEDYNLNEERFPVTPQWIRTGNRPDGNVAKLEIIDELTWKLIFDGPYGGLPIRLAYSNYSSMIQPSNEMKKYHPKYASPEDLAALCEKFGYEPEEWYNLYEFAEISSWNSGRETQLTTPHLGPYIYIKDGEPRMYERNPYYFKIDSEGNQLPYIDQVASVYVTDNEAAGIRILGGEIDFAYEWVPLDKVALYKENEEKGGYRLLTNTALHRTAADIFFNMTYADETWRSIVRDVRFRQALNLALNKQDIVDTVYYTFAKPSDMQGTEQDLEEAGRLLDEMGMKIGADGFRTTPDGSPFTLTYNTSDAFTQYVPTAQLVAEQWRAIGLKVDLRVLDNTLLGEMATANEIQVGTVFTHGAVTAMWNDWGQNYWGRLWYLWYTTAGKQGEEPPADVLEFYKLYDSINTEPSSKLPEIRQALRDSMKNNLWYLLPVEGITQLSLINKDLMNFPDAGYLISNSWAAEQWWFNR